MIDDPRPPRRHASRAHKRRRRALGGLFIKTVGLLVFRLLASTWRVERIGWEAFERRSATQGALAAIWHENLAMGLWPHRHRGYHGLVSPHADGDLLCELLARMGYGAVRGSTNKRSAAAVREVLRELEGPVIMVITPDGPRGPRHHVGRGMAWLARASGVPLVPARLDADRAWRLGTWDRHVVPKPFARVRIHYGDPLPLGDDDDDLAERLRAKLLEPIGTPDPRDGATAGADR